MIDRLLALILLFFFGIPIIVLIIISTIVNSQFGIFTQKRVGLHGKPFTIFKIRTLKGNFQSTVTQPKMNRTPFGNFLRQYHLDELPQLFNILIGDMKFVGPRPDTTEAYNLLSEKDFQKLTSVKPGITGPVQLENFNEEFLIAQQENPEQYYYQVLWPKKVKKNIDYFSNRKSFSDFKIIFDTLKKLFN